MSRRLGNNIITAIIAMLLLMTSFALTFTPSSSAQSTVPGFTPMPDRATQTEVAVSPSIIGLGQETLINIMTYPGPSGPTYEAQSLVPELHGGFSNISITIKHPDGTDETFKPIDETLAQVGVEIPGQAQIVGHLQFRYKPTAVGNYTLTASFPGQIYTTAGISSTVKLSAFYKPSQSTVPAKLVVQQEPVLNGLLNGYPWSPLPNEYWENPVSTNNREWYQISGDWVQTGFDSAGSAYNPFSKAPGSAHILWRYQVGDGGLPGGIWGSNPYQAQGTIFGAPIILNGRVYRNGNPGYFECIDLRTGEKLWEAPGSINSAQNLDPEFQTHSQQAEGYIDSWLWGGTGPALFAPGSNTWYRYNPFNGALVQAITNVPTDMTGLKFQDGSPIVFAVQANMSSWNTTKPLKLSSVNLIKWDFSKMITTVGFFNLPSNNWTDGIVWNVTVNTGDQVDIGDNNFRGPNVYPYYGENVVVVKTPNAMQIMAGYDMNTGRMIWKNNATVFDIDVLLQGIATSPSGPLIKQDGSTPNLVAYDVKTGQEIWRAPSGDIPWGLLPSYTYVYNNGTHFAGSFDGHVYAYDSKTGKQVWRSDYVGEEWETIYGNQPLTGYLAAGADGKLYFSSQTVYNMMPRPRFHTLVCVDEATGKFIWKLPIGAEPLAIADGYLLGQDNDNGLLYCFGKGKTSTTVRAQQLQSGLLIEGSVMDLSPGKPNTPAVADTDMSTWMDYLYGQNATLLNNPPKPKGVPVKITATGQDGKVTDLGTVTTDSNGNFGFYWNSTNTGLHTISAVFEGSESYWRSSADTSGVIANAQTSTTEPTGATGLTVSEIVPYIIGAAVAIIIAIAIVGILILRKH